MKKILLLITVLLTGVFLVSCSNTKEFDIVKDENLILFYQGDTEDNVTRDVTLLLKSLEVDNATITWVSDKPEVVEIFGSKGQVFRGETDETVKLTATIKIGKKTQNVDFSIVVKATPPVTKYTVTFSVDGGSPVSNLVVTEGSLINKPADPTKDGNTFLGWYKDSEFANAWVFTADKVNANTTLYAKWAQEGTQVESKLYEFDFSSSNVGNSYGGNLGVTKQLTNLVGQETDVVLHRVAVNNNHSVYTD
ncbi:MAG: InlB B-repeat-containing protein, partial [Bacilli bacterium]